MSVSAVTITVLSLLFAVSNSKCDDPKSKGLFVRGNEPFSWLDANKWCQEEGWQLASIHSATELATALATANGQGVWLGGVRSYVDRSQWQWSDRTQWRYSNWNLGEPNDGGSTGQPQACTQMYSSGKWDDLWCDYERVPLCRTSSNPKYELLWEGWSPERAMERCMGDCDGDYECVDDLKCVHDTLPDGCTGSIISYGDYCAEMSMNAAATFDLQPDPDSDEAAVANKALEPATEWKWNPLIAGAAVGAVVVLLSAMLLVMLKRRKRGARPQKKRVAKLSSLALDAPNVIPVTTETVAGPELDVDAITVQ